MASTTAGLKNLGDISNTGIIDNIRGQYWYQAQVIGVDTIGDWRMYSDANGFYIQKCTVANATKGAGTWVTVHTFS